MSRNWFSNFLPFDDPLVHGNTSYATVEHFYQSMKTINDEDRKKIADCSTPGMAKKVGRKVCLRSNWDQLKLQFMQRALEYKFKPGTSWHKKLMESKEELIEWNYWHDNYWGICTCNRCSNIMGENHLGKILMTIREKLISKS